MLDIGKEEDELLAEMKSKTRYNIKLAEKKGVRVIISREKKYLDRFFELVEITARRQGIVSHPKNYYQEMVRSLPEENMKIFCAEFEGKIIAANLVLFFDGVATYLHGASDDNFRNVMAPYLLQWRQVQEAKKNGAKRYDFGGVKTADKDKGWAGISRFKKSFSPITKTIVFPGAYDMIISATRYYLYRFIQKIKCIL
jgi:lipid II:glycine glycyltransferase (peptidoglycan interpeptide bridge formation enzyme)